MLMMMPGLSPCAPCCGQLPSKTGGEGGCVCVCGGGGGHVHPQLHSACVFCIVGRVAQAAYVWLPLV
jgi:hypothetical protein